MRVYRLVKERYAPSGLDGAGAKLYGGRWNLRGQALLYTSDSIALTALELLVHLHRSEILNSYHLITLDVPDAALLTLDDAELPADWRADPPPASTAAIGAAWLKGASSIGLLVPSVLIPKQRNILLNPAHPDFPAAAATAAFEPFDFDSRLVR